MSESQLIADAGARDTEHARAVRDTFGRIAGTYDALNRAMSWGVDVRWRKRAIAALAEDLGPGAIADVCAGTLDLSAEMAERWPGRRIVALDFARPMLVAAGEKSGPTVTRVVADAMRLPLADGSVAGVICGFGLRNLVDARRGIGEMKRVLRPGGALVVLEFFRPVRAATKWFHALYARGVLPAVGGAFSGDMAAYRYLAASMRGFLSREELEAVMAEEGLGQVRGEDLTLGVASIVRGVV
jgi:demethylmenaquinone methyltransferase / 2-methoxy-6-polyprenyl-1,4-benzoquinol methylase